MSKVNHIVKNPNFYNRLLYVRLAHGLTQKQFAKELLLDTANYARYERCEAQISLVLIMRVHKKFCATCDYICGSDKDTMINPYYVDVANNLIEFCSSSMSAVSDDVSVKTAYRRMLQFAEDEIKIAKKKYDRCFKGDFYVYG